MEDLRGGLVLGNRTIILIGMYCIVRFCFVVMLQQ